MKKSILIAVLSIASINGYSAPPKHLSLSIEAPDALKGTLAGIYCGQGGLNDAYIITFKGGAYSAIHQEVDGGIITKTKLENLSLDETNNIVSFNQGKDAVKGKITENGLIIDEVIYAKFSTKE